jgi:hypothetical protein
MMLHRGRVAAECAIASVIVVTIALLAYHVVAGPTAVTAITISTTSGFDVSTWIGTGAAIAAIGSALVALWTLRRTSATVGAQTMFETYIGWDSQRIRQARTKAAAAFVPELSATQDWSSVHIGPDATDVLNYIELIGVFVCDDQVIATDQAWSAFTSIVVPWFGACERRVAQARIETGDPTLLISAERLYRVLCKCDAEKRVAAMRALGKELKKSARELTGSAKDSRLAQANELKKATLTPAEVASSREDILEFLKEEAKLEDADTGTTTPTSVLK